MVYINWDHELGGACEMLGVINNWNPELRGNQALIHNLTFRDKTSLICDIEQRLRELPTPILHIHSALAYYAGELVSVDVL